VFVEGSLIGIKITPEKASYYFIRRKKLKARNWNQRFKIKLSISGKVNVEQAQVSEDLESINQRPSWF